MVVLEIGGRFMKSLRFYNICNILRNHKNYSDSIVPVDSSANLLSNVIGINGKLRFE